MPRPNRPRTLGSESALAQRLAWERDRRKMTYDGLAERMTAAGCAIQGSALYKIEKSGRRITVDELVALAKVFEVAVEDLLRPLETVLFAEIGRVAERESAALEALFDAVEEMYAALTARFELWRRAVDQGETDLEEALRSWFGYDRRGFMEGIDAEMEERFPTTPLQPGRLPVHHLANGMASLAEGLYGAAEVRVWPPSGSRTLLPLPDGS